MENDVRLAMEREITSCLVGCQTSRIFDDEGAIDMCVVDALTHVCEQALRAEIARQRDRIAVYVRGRGITKPGEYPPSLDRVAEEIRDGDAD